jgi:hypothetical protein
VRHRRKPRWRAHSGGARGGGVRHQCGGTRRGHGGGRAVEVHTEDAEEERAPADVWQGNDRVRIYGLEHT